MAASASVTSAPLNRSTVSGKAKKRQKFAPKLTGGAKVADKAQVTGRPIHVDGKAVPDIDSSTTADAGADLGVSTEKSVLLTVDTTTDKNAHINMGNGVLDGTTGAKVDKPRRKTKFAPKKIATTQRKVVAAMNRSTVVMETEKVITEYSAVRGSGVLAGALTGERMQEVGLGKDANTEKHKESVRADTQVATTTVSNLPYGSETKGAEVTTETIQSIVAPTNPTSTSLNAVESVHEPITVSKGEIAATRTNSNVIENTLNTVDTSTNATVADMTTEVAVTKKAKRSKFAPKKFSARIPAKATVAQPAVVSTVDTTHTQRKTSDAREDTRAALGLLGEGSELESHTRAPLPIDASLRGTGQSGANAEAHAHTSVVHAHDQNERHGLKQAQDKNRIRGDSQASKDMIESVLGAVEVSEKAEWAVDTVLGKAAENSQMVTIDPPGSQEARLDTEDQNLTVSETMARVAQIVAEKRKARKAIDAHNRDEAIASQAMVKLSKAGPVRREVFDMSGPESDYNGRSSMALPPPPTRPTAATARGIEASDMESDVYLTNEFDTQPTAKRVPITQDLDVSECEAAPIAITKRRKLMRKGEPVEGYISKSSSNDDSDSDAPLSLLAENNRRKKPKKKSTYKRKAPSKALTTTKWAKNQITDASDGGLYTDIHTDAGGEDVISIDELKKRALKKVKEKEKKPRKSKQSKTVREVQSDGTVTEVMQIDVAKRSRRPATKTVALVPPTTLMSELVHTNPIANPTKQEHKRRERKKVAVKIKTIEKAQKHIRIRVRSLKAHMEGLRAK
ncbi:hypothetical protein SARC_01907 [Sphaeroforma arctica JP610]|uniref:Uncharacterized protein n=1 Tax=Sphaeroforma arctica JP610 TaxID=667725 RepID=A0A0L0GAI0_9EUKA|nr:hypothetical protein SARC_01907 [Sphaeroforma arctica JP610]KNC85914.1 hypothetical protein SARC_01907 [Sphaeroforma arctica JP610]|eukprot:XP_014159816.1 hypothetical protein SARC_01907 [Sphaeroforma arctica JP610]